MDIGFPGGFRHQSRSTAGSGVGGGRRRGADGLVEEALVGIAAPRFPVDSRSVRQVVEVGSIDDLVRKAISHGLGPVLSDILESERLEVPDALRRRVEADRILRLRSMAVLANVADALDSSGIPWVVFKGPAVASFMSRPELRRFNDLDILVPGAQFGEAIEVLRGAGIEELNRNWDGYVKHRVGEIPMTAGPVLVDLHWQIVGLGVVRRTMSLDPATMLNRRRRRRVGQTEVSIFGAEDQLLHLSLHSALGGAHTLYQLRDIAVLCDADVIDWQEFAARSREFGAARLVAHAIDRSRLVVGANVDADYLREIGGVSVGVRRRVDRWSRRPSSNQRAFFVRMWRDRFGATLQSISRQTNSRLRSLLGRGVGWDAGDVNGPLYYGRESGGEAQRSVFLRGASQWE